MEEFITSELKDIISKKSKRERIKKVSYVKNIVVRIDHGIGMMALYLIEGKMVCGKSANPKSQAGLHLATHISHGSSLVRYPYFLMK